MELPEYLKLESSDKKNEVLKIQKGAVDVLHRSLFTYFPLFISSQIHSRVLSAFFIYLCNLDYIGVYIVFHK